MMGCFGWSCQAAYKPELVKSFWWRNCILFLFFADFLFQRETDFSVFIISHLDNLVKYKIWVVNFIQRTGFRGPALPPAVHRRGAQNFPGPSGTLPRFETFPNKYPAPKEASQHSR